MNFDHFFAASRDKIVTAGLVGAGQFGASLINQAQHMPLLDVPFLCDLDLVLAKRAFLDAGVAEEDIFIAESASEAKRAAEQGKKIITENYRLICELPADIIVEATGQPEAAASIAYLALTSGYHVAMVTKEADIVVGPYLSRIAAQAGRFITPVDGDQPSLLIGLMSWSKLLGLDVLAAGKSSEYDFIYHPDRDVVSWRGHEKHLPGFRDIWAMGGDMQACLAARAEMLAGFPQRTVPDLCEMGIVCNHTGLLPDAETFHAPHARVREVADLFIPQDRGGILSAKGKVDVFNCLRRADEQSFAGGVYVVVDCVGTESWKILGEKGIPMSRDGKAALLYNPSHLLGVEAPVSLLSTVLLGKPSGATELVHHVDLHARTTRAWKKGEVLAITDHHHHEVDGLEPLLRKATPANKDAPLPYYMAAGQQLACDVPVGSLITREMIIEPSNATLFRLRDEMDGLTR